MPRRHGYNLLAAADRKGSPPTSSAWARCPTMTSKAESIAIELFAFRTISCRPILCAADCTSTASAAWGGLSGLMSIAMARARRNHFAQQAEFLCFQEGCCDHRPVTLPSGRLKLATRPDFDRIAACHENDRNSGGRRFRATGANCTRRHASSTSDAALNQDRWLATATGHSRPAPNDIRPSRCGPRRTLSFRPCRNRIDDVLERFG